MVYVSVLLALLHPFVSFASLSFRVRAARLLLHAPYCDVEATLPPVLQNTRKVERRQELKSQTLPRGRMPRKEARSPPRAPLVEPPL